MNAILVIAIAATLLTSLLIAVRWGSTVCQGSMPSSLFAFSAILFTSGLDVGLIMFPLTEFPVYAEEAAYQFANPLAIEFGMWGFLVWAFYFLTTFYFCRIEPRLQLFEIPIIKFVNNFVVIATCAFTGFLFLSYLPSYVEGISPIAQYSLVFLVVICAVFSSTDIRYVKVLSIASTWLFFALIAFLWINSKMGLIGFLNSSSNLSEYFGNLHRFLSPLSDYHAFYLFWWFSWSIMIGQFVSRFLSPMKTRSLLAALLIIPSIPIAVWFSVLYYYHTHDVELTKSVNLCLVTVGVIFVINSLDSLIRLYTTNLGITVERLGRRNYVLFNAVALLALILLYRFTPFEIEWVGLVVIGLYGCIYFLLFRRREKLSSVMVADA
ncbi:BCCT family transporter [Candidatus Marimicrobium litorale]|uniref:BCCT family transporter n=1 Tax=Candidatus Marimicrobium litorale TaxID=2518991 RepID=A0ABT3T8P3_9GAMM|nr:BCCT family transporter [Candidatus Marimicrobium litorale]MCX2978648.1 BCCT family transporter [Candidatus Marimicrobium litorale]